MAPRPLSTKVSITKLSIVNAKTQRDILDPYRGRHAIFITKLIQD